MSLFEIKPGTPSVEEFLDLRGSVEMGTRSLEGVKRGLGNELFGVVKAYQNIFLGVMLFASNFVVLNYSEVMVLMLILFEVNFESNGSF